ncbi:rcc01693 family protein [Rhodopseudomonas julia]|uniref:rcc01693 family protein n=1 Tax=Rhodopseudomonas julia TaxID=200617 RepID=UPI0027D7AC49|nr:rcc01693 family protein [Rhodopseudomonas julia]
MCKDRRGAFAGDFRGSADGRRRFRRSGRNRKKPSLAADGRKGGRKGGTREAAKAFPWQEAIAFGLAVLRLSPRDFWAMTPREFSACRSALFGAGKTPLTAGELAQLIARFPDR